MITFPNAKINIGLNITHKRADGFHDIESVFYPVKLCDAVEVVEDTKRSINKISFTFSGIPIPGNGQENLCVRAYHLINADYPLPPVKAHLHKHIPVGAGLGGGSADAAFFIKLINDKFDLGLAWGELHHYAKQLGSDCSFFITNKPVVVIGKGDEYESISLNLTGLYFVLVYPGIHVNTADAYKSCEPKQSTRSLESDVIHFPVKEWKYHIKNDFEKTIFQKFPGIKIVKEKLYALGALYASMSGSGSSVYGIFEKPVHLTNDFKNMYVWEFLL